MGDAFEDRLTGSMNTLVSEQGKRAEVPKERQFVGFDAYQKVIDSCICLPPTAVALTGASFCIAQFILSIEWHACSTM